MAYKTPVRVIIRNAILKDAYEDAHGGEVFFPILPFFFLSFYFTFLFFPCPCVPLHDFLTIGLPVHFVFVAY